MEEAESSDTQSMDTSPRHPRTKPTSDISDVTYPKESDTQKLFDLMGVKKKNQNAPTVAADQKKLQVQQVTPRNFDSGSSSSGSEPSSPQLSMRTESAFGYSDSIRSSIRSSSVISSEGNMTIVTESCISDIDTVSIMSEVPQETPILVPGKSLNTATNHVLPSETNNQPIDVDDSPDSVINKPPLPTPTQSLSPDDYVPAETIVVHKLTSTPRRDSMSSDSDEEMTTEQITRVKFVRVSKKDQRSRSPSPPSNSKHKQKPQISKGEKNIYKNSSFRI